MNLFTAQASNGTCLVRTSVEQLTIRESGRLLPAFDNLLTDHRAKHIIIDMTSVRFIDSSAVGVLVQACRSAERSGGRFSLVNACDQVQRMLSLCNVDQLIERVERVPETD